MSGSLRALVRQLEAGLSTLQNVIQDCPDDYWDAKDNDYPFSQVAFHTLFYIDYYLHDTVEEMENQDFHTANKDSFRDYEELEDKLPKHLYSKEFIRNYLIQCHALIQNLELDGTGGKLGDPARINNKDMTVLEMLVYVIRHIQHHAAQLGLRIQTKTGKEMDWIGSGWKEGWDERAVKRKTSSGSQR